MSNYSVGFIANDVSPAMQDMITHANQVGGCFERIPCRLISLDSLASAQWLHGLLRYDVIYYRIGLRRTILAEVIQFCRKHNKLLINASEKHPYSHEKIQQAIIAGQCDIPQPATYWGPATYQQIVAELNDTFVIKPNVGAHGTAVALIHTEQEFIDYTAENNVNNCIYQEYIVPDGEYRVYTLGNQGVSSYKRILGNDDFRGNLHAGATMTATEPELSNSLHVFAGQIAEKFGCHIAGVDVLYKDGAFLFLELNWQPGWDGSRTLTDVNQPNLTYEYIQRLAAQRYAAD
jgi:glutathione synthase/RimK-type ligase-like ATP-grasp enzyme